MGITVPANANSIVTSYPAGGALLDTKKVSPSMVKVTDTELPASIDLSYWAMPVGDQGQVASCVAWAINYGMMGWFSRYQNISLSGTSFAPMYVYSQIHDNNDSDGGGAYPADAYTVSNTQGVDTQSHYLPQGDFDWKDKPTAAEKENAAQNKSSKMVILYNTGIALGPPADNIIKASLANFRPVALTIPVYHAFDVLNATNYSLDARQVVPSTFRGLHAVLAVGYDTTGVIIENSWSTNWGKQGYAHLNWSFIEQYTYEASTMEGLQAAPVPPAPEPQVPSAPSSLTISANNVNTATIYWHPPDGDAIITGYRISQNGVGAYSKVVSYNSRLYKFTSLKPNSKYIFSVSAIDVFGSSPPISITTTTRPALSSPQRLSVTRNRTERFMTVHWYTPAYNGGYPIARYRVTITHGKWTHYRIVSASTRSQKFNSLHRGYTYTFTVQALTANAVSSVALGHARL